MKITSRTGGLSLPPPSGLLQTKYHTGSLVLQPNTYLQFWTHARHFSCSSPCWVAQRPKNRKAPPPPFSQKKTAKRVTPVKKREEEEEEDLKDLEAFGVEIAEGSFLYDDEELEGEDEEERKYKKKLRKDLRSIDNDLRESELTTEDDEDDFEENKDYEAIKKRDQEKLKKLKEKDPLKKLKEEAIEKERAARARAEKIAKARVKKLETLKKDIESYRKAHQTVPAREIAKIFRKMAFLRVSKEEEAKLMASLMPLVGLITSDSVKEFTALINIFGKRKKFDAVMLLFNRMKDTETKKRQERMQKLLTKEEKLAYMFHLDVFAFNAVINACVINDRQAEAFAVFDELMLRWQEEKQRKEGREIRKGNEDPMTVPNLKEGRYKPTVVTFGMLLSLLGRTDNIPKANELLRFMEADHVEPDIHIFNTLLSMNAKKGNMVEVMKLVDILKGKELKPDEISYTCMVRACVINTAQVLARMADNDKAAKEKTTKLYAKGVSFLDMIVKEMLAQNVRPDAEFMKALINGYGTFGAIEKMFTTFDLLSKEEGISPDPSVCAIMLVHCGRLKDMNNAYRVFDFMKRQKVRPSQALFMDFLRTCALCGRNKDAVQVFSILKGWMRDFPFDEDFFFGLFNTYEGVEQLKLDGAKEGNNKNNNIENAKLKISDETFKEIFEAMAANQFRPTVAAYNALIHAYGLSGNLARCWQAIERMRSRKMPPNQLTYRYIIFAHIQAPKVIHDQQETNKDNENNNTSTAEEEDKQEKLQQSLEGKSAWEILTEIKKDRVPLDTKMYNSLIKLCEMHKNPKDAYQLFLQMRKEEVQTNVTTLRNVIGACQNDIAFFSEVEQLKFLLGQLTDTLPVAPPSQQAQQLATPPNVKPSNQ